MAAEHQLARSLVTMNPVVPDPGDGGTIDVTAVGVCSLVTAAAETRTLPAPEYVGQWLILMMDTDGGDCVVTAAVDVDGSGNNVLTFDAIGESVYLVGVSVSGALRWQIYENVGTVGTA